MASSNLPLHCNICPKKPNFSDVSHLLTHIASKGHLSHYYKVKVRSSTDQAAKDQIDVYDDWYARWNVEELMSQRMHHKDKKRSRARGQGNIRHSDVPAHLLMSEGSTARVPKKVAKQRRTAVDPLLGGGFNAHMPFEGDGDLVASSFYPQVELPLPAKMNRPKLHLWSTQRPSSYSAILVDFSSSPPIFPTNNSSSNRTAGQGHSASLAAAHNLDGGIDEEDEEVIAEAAKLKGVLWPGMDLFDSATPEMKKKRNQRKDVSVVEQLEQNSQVVEPTEMIFYQTGGLKKQRKISGRVESSTSPTESPHVSPAMLHPAPRLPLTHRDVNSSSLRAPRAANVAPEMNGQHRPPEAVMTSRGGRKRRSIADSTTMTALPARQRKREFQVFKDDQESTFGNPTGMNCLTSEFHYEPCEDNAKQRQLQSQPAPMHFGPSTMAYSNGQFQEPFVPFPSYQTYYGPPHYSMYGPPGYDLAALLASHLQQSSHEPESREGQRDRRRQQADCDSALTISDASIG